METFSMLLAVCAGNSPVTDELPAQSPVTGIFDILNGWVNKHEAGDLRRHRTHYDFTVMLVNSELKLELELENSLLDKIAHSKLQ